MGGESRWTQTVTRAAITDTRGAKLSSEAPRGGDGRGALVPSEKEGAGQGMPKQEQEERAQGSQAGRVGAPGGLSQRRGAASEGQTREAVVEEEAYRWRRGSGLKLREKDQFVEKRGCS